MGVRTPQITEEKHFLITFQDYQPKSSVDRKQSKISEAIADDDDEATTNIIDHKRRQVILRLSAFGHWFLKQKLYIETNVFSPQVFGKSYLGQ